MKGKQRGTPTSSSSNITPTFLSITIWPKLFNTFVQQTTIAPIYPHLGKINVATRLKMAAQILPSWGSRENGKKKLHILSINIWGDGFYQPLPMGHQKFLVPVAPTNFSILACTMVKTIQHFGPQEGGQGGWGRGLQLGAPREVVPQVRRQWKASYNVVPKTSRSKSTCKLATPVYHGSILGHGVYVCALHHLPLLTLPCVADVYAPIWDVSRMAGSSWASLAK